MLWSDWNLDCWPVKHWQGHRAHAQHTVDKGPTAIMHRMWLTCQQCGNHNQNMANMATLWKSFSKDDKHTSCVLIMLKRWKYGYSMAIILKTWQTYLQCGNHAQNVANIATMWQLSSKCGKLGHNMAIIFKTWLQCSNHYQNMAKIVTVWQSCLKHSKHAHIVAIILKMWQKWPQYGNHTKTWQSLWQSYLKNGNHGHGIDCPEGVGCF